MASRPGLRQGEQAGAATITIVSVTGAVLAEDMSRASFKVKAWLG